jgi:ubiquinone/menaquinone biosynthesis C-methylase UbiE
MGIEHYRAIPATNDLHDLFIGREYGAMLYADNSRFWKEPFNGSMFNTEELEMLAERVTLAWEQSSIPNLPPFDEVLQQASQIRKSSGNPTPLPIFTAVQGATLGVLNRIRNAFSEEELPPENYRYSVVVPSILVDSLGKAVVSGDFRAEYFQDTDAVISATSIEDLRAAIYKIVGEHRSFAVYTEEDWSAFTDALTTIFSQEWAVSLFVESLQYRSSPMSPITSMTFDTLDAFTPEGCRQAYPMAKAIAEIVVPGDMVLDCGTGIGASARLIARGIEDKGATVIAVDRQDLSQQNPYAHWLNNFEIDGQVIATKAASHLKDQFYEQAAGAQSNLIFMNASGVWKKSDANAEALRDEDFTGALPFADKTFKVVVLGYVLNHMAVETGQALTAELMRILRDDGLILIEQGEGEQYKVYKSLDSQWLQSWIDEIAKLDSREEVKEALFKIVTMESTSIWNLYNSLTAKDKEVFVSRFDWLSARLDFKDMMAASNVIKYLKFRDAMHRIADASIIDDSFIGDLHILNDYEKFTTFLSELDLELVEAVISRIEAVMKLEGKLAEEAKNVLISYTIATMEVEEYLTATGHEFVKQVAVYGQRSHNRAVEKAMANILDKDLAAQLLALQSAYGFFADVVKTMQRYNPEKDRYIPHMLKSLKAEQFELITTEDWKMLAKLVESLVKTARLSEEFAEIARWLLALKEV